MTKSGLRNHLGTTGEDCYTYDKSIDLKWVRSLHWGYFSSFFAAYKVEVISKHNDDSQHIWTSSDFNFYTIESDNSVDLKRGAIVRLYLKDSTFKYCKFE